MHRVTLPARLRLTLVLGATMLALASCRDATGPLPRNGPPQSLEFTIGGFGGETILLRTTGETVLLIRRDWSGPAADTVRMVPSEAAWRQFWASTRAAGVPSWKDRYENDDIVDGTGWGLHIGLDGEDLRSQGSNAYPDRFGGRHSDMTPAFRDFVGALATLVGQDLVYGAQPEL